MPTSIDPPPAEDETECGRCGAHFYIGLTRCPNCGVNLYEPDEEAGGADKKPSRPANAHPKAFGARLDGFFRRLTRKPYPVEQLFGAAINQAELFDDLLTKTGGDRAAVERLIDFERSRFPQENRIRWLERAIRRWEQDNRINGSK